MRRTVLILLAVLLFGLTGCLPRIQVSLPEPVDVMTFGPTFYCGYQKGAPLPHQVFAPSGGSVRLTLLGGESAAVDVAEGYTPESAPTAVTPLFANPGELNGCVLPPQAATFDPGGPFVLVHTFGAERQRVYSLDELNQDDHGMLAYQALNAAGEPVGVLLFVEEWVDADYDDAVLLLQGATPLR